MTESPQMTGRGGGYIMETISSFFSTFAINTHPLVCPSIPHPATLGFGQFDQKPRSLLHVHVLPSTTAKSINQLLSKSIIGVPNRAPHLKQWSAAAHVERQKASRQTDTRHLPARGFCYCVCWVFQGVGRGKKSHYGDFHGTDGLQMYR